MLTAPESTKTRRPFPMLPERKTRPSPEMIQTTPRTKVRLRDCLQGIEQENDPARNIENADKHIEDKAPMPPRSQRLQHLIGSGSSDSGSNPNGADSGAKDKIGDDENAGDEENDSEQGIEPPGSFLAFAS